MKKFLSRVCFITEEASRNLKLNYLQSLKYLVLTMLSLFLISITIVVIFNLNYLCEVFSNDPLPESPSVANLSLLYRFNNFKYALYFTLMVIILVLFYINRKYLSCFLKSYRKEMELINRLNGDKNLMRLPFLYITFFINGFAVIIAWVAAKLIYSYFLKLSIFNVLKISLLSFNYFKITLLFLLFFIGPGVGLVVSYYLIWSLKY